MDREEFKAALTQLHQQLRSGESVDPEVAALLLQVTAELGLLAASESAAEAEQKQSLVDRLLGMTKEFEESHPQLAEAMGRVATAFSRIGI